MERGALRPQDPHGPGLRGPGRGLGGHASSPALEESSNGRIDPPDHKLVKRLLPEFLDEIAEAEAKEAELEGRLEAAQAGDEEDEEATTTRNATCSGKWTSRRSRGDHAGQEAGSASCRAN